MHIFCPYNCRKCTFLTQSLHSVFNNLLNSLTPIVELISIYLINKNQFERFSNLGFGFKGYDFSEKINIMELK